MSDEDDGDDDEEDTNGEGDNTDATARPTISDPLLSSRSKLVATLGVVGKTASSDDLAILRQNPLKYKKRRSGGISERSTIERGNSVSFTENDSSPTMNRSLPSEEDGKGRCQGDSDITESKPEESLYTLIDFMV